MLAKVLVHDRDAVVIDNEEVEVAARFAFEITNSVIHRRTDSNLVLFVRNHSVSSFNVTATISIISLPTRLPDAFVR